VTAALGITGIAEYVAPAATMIAACMTAANLGPRLTGWGFVVFTLGSLAWSAVAIASGQQNLLLTNAFLTLVNAVGVWRWLGRMARFSDGAKAAEKKSEAGAAPTLVSIGAIAGRAILDASGEKIGSAVGLMAAVDTGQVAYLVGSIGGVGGIGERLVALPWEMLDLAGEALVAQIDERGLAKLPDLDPADWPAHAKAQNLA
jgi:PRC-barrel domain